MTAGRTLARPQTEPLRRRRYGIAFRHTISICVLLQWPPYQTWRRRFISGSATALRLASQQTALHTPATRTMAKMHAPHRTRPFAGVILEGNRFTIAAHATAMVAPAMKAGAAQRVTQIQIPPHRLPNAHRSATSWLHSLKVWVR